jgi:hypothetical protein
MILRLIHNARVAAVAVWVGDAIGGGSGRFVQQPQESQDSPSVEIASAITLNLVALIG